MISFWEAVFSPEGQFLRNALIVGLLAAPAFGIMGTLVVTRRMSAMAGAISHASLAGIGGGLWLQFAWGWTWFSPFVGAVLVGAVSAGILTWMTVEGEQRSDSTISFLWAVGMSIGLLFFYATPQYVDPMSYLFGNILLIRTSDLWWLLGLDAVVLGAWAAYHRPLTACCFDEEFARQRGLNVAGWFFLLLLLTAWTIILLIQLVGVVLVIALLTLPAATAGIWFTRLNPMMIAATVLCAVGVLGGLWLSYALEGPTGPLVVVVLGAVYLGSSFRRQ